MSGDIDYTQPSVLNAVHRDLREAVKVAHRFGWTGRKRSRGGLLLYSPDGIHTVQVPTTVGDSHTVRNTQRAIVRWTPDEVKARVLPDVLTSEPEMADTMNTLIAEAKGAFGVGVLEPGMTQAQEPVVAPTIIETKPWMARVSSNGKTSDFYESPTTVERHWSNGIVDYQCKACEYARPKARSVVSHYANAHVAKGQVPSTGTPVPTMFDVKVDGYRTVRVAHLAKEIEAALNALPDGDLLHTTDKGTGPLARYLATHIITERLAKGKERIEDEPEEHTADDILARIRTLLGREEQREIARLETEAANLRTQIAEEEQRTKAAKEDARKAHDRWRALTELVTGEPDN